MDENAPIIIEDRDAHRRVVINRPRKANAINRETLDALARVIEETARLRHVRLLEITGSGERVFCAGADLSEVGMETGSSELARAYDRQWDLVTSMIAGLPCLTIANINGACIGGGLSIALACDMRIAAGHASFSYPAASHGFMPSPDDVHRIVELIGRPFAKSILMAGQRISAEEAVRIGLVSDLSSGFLEKISSNVEGGKFVSALAIKRLIDSQEMGEKLIRECYSAVYDADADAMVSLLRK